MRKIVPLLIVLSIAGCRHRESRQELLERVSKSEHVEGYTPVAETNGTATATATVSPAMEAALNVSKAESAGVNVTFVRVGSAPGGMLGFEVTVDNRGPNNLRSISGQVVITTTSNPGGIQLGFEIPQAVAAGQTMTYTMPVERDPSGQESRWPREDEITGATFRVDRVELAR
jgi:hypothetical protein